MSRWMEYPVGSTTVPIDLTINDSNGGVSGDTPTFKIRRVSDNRYLDFADQTFKTSGHTQISQSLADQGDGRYVYLWNSSQAVTTPLSVVIEYSNAGSTAPGVDNDVIAFTATAGILANIAKSPLASVGDGPGSCRFVYKLNYYNSSRPIVGANVYVTSDAAGLYIIAGPKLTDSDGKAEFYLNIGTPYYFWRSKGGVTFTNPDVETLS